MNTASGWHGKWRELAFMAGLIGILSACATSYGNKQLLDFLQDGKTTREQVILHLGTPSATFQGEQIVTYRIDQDDKGGYITLGAANRGWGKYSLVLVFDENRVLRRHSLVKVER